MLLSFRPNFCFCFQLFPFVLILSSKIRIVRMQALFYFYGTKVFESICFSPYYSQVG